MINIKGMDKAEVLQKLFNGLGSGDALSLRATVETDTRPDILALCGGM